MADHLEGDDGSDDAPDAGEEGVNGHVIGHAIGRCELGDPQGPGDIAAGGGDPVDDGPDEETGGGVGREERGNAEGEAEVEGAPQGEEVHAIEQTPPDGAHDEACEVGDDEGEEGDFAGGLGHAVPGIAEVFHPEREHGEVGETHEHPGDEGLAKDAVLVDMGPCVQRMGTGGGRHRSGGDSAEAPGGAGEGDGEGEDEKAFAGGDESNPMEEGLKESGGVWPDGIEPETGDGSGGHGGADADHDGLGEETPAAVGGIILLINLRHEGDDGGGGRDGDDAGDGEGKAPGRGDDDGEGQGHGAA